MDEIFYEFFRDQQGEKEKRKMREKKTQGNNQPATTLTRPRVTYTIFFFFLTKSRALQKHIKFLSLPLSPFHLTLILTKTSKRSQIGMS